MQNQKAIELLGQGRCRVCIDSAAEMKALVLESLADFRMRPIPLSLRNVPEPTLNDGEVLLRVTRCGVCHTELDEIEGRTPPPHLPVILGHQVIGIVEDGKNKG